MSESVTPEDVVRRPGWRPLTIELPKDWQEGYLQSRPHQPWVLFDGAAALEPARPR